MSSNADPILASSTVAFCDRSDRQGKLTTIIGPAKPNKRRDDRLVLQNTTRCRASLDLRRFGPRVERSSIAAIGLKHNGLPEKYARAAIRDCPLAKPYSCQCPALIKTDVRFVALVRAGTQIRPAISASAHRSANLAKKSPHCMSCKISRSRNRSGTVTVAFPARSPPSPPPIVAPQWLPLTRPHRGPA